MALMSEPVTSLQDDTRKQLGAFLRARRERLEFYMEIYSEKPFPI